MKKSVIFCILSLIVSLSATAQIKIIAAIAESWAKEDKKSFAGTVIKKMNFDGELKISYEVKPLLRAASAFSKGKYDCFFGGNKNDFNSYLDSNLLTSSDPVLKNDIRILTLKKNNKISKFDKVSSMRGSHITGLENILSQNKNIPKLKNVYKVPDILQSLKMIQLGRIDYIVHWSPLAKQLRDKLHYDQNLSLYNLEARMNCFKNQKNIKFLEIFNKRLKQLNENDSVQKLYRNFLDGTK